MAELHETLMGRKLIEGTLPDIAEQLKRIADILEKKEETFVDVSELIETIYNDQELGEKIRKLYGRNNKS
jgi:hypothetical protein